MYIAATYASKAQSSYSSSFYCINCKKAHYITGKTKYNQLIRSFVCPNCDKQIVFKLECKPKCCQNRKKGILNTTKVLTFFVTIQFLRQFSRFLYRLFKFIHVSTLQVFGLISKFSLLFDLISNNKTKTCYSHNYIIEFEPLFQKNPLPSSPNYNTQ